MNKHTKSAGFNFSPYATALMDILNKHVFQDPVQLFMEMLHDKFADAGMTATIEHHKNVGEVFVKVDAGPNDLCMVYHFHESQIYQKTTDAEMSLFCESIVTSFVDHLYQTKDD